MSDFALTTLLAVIGDLPTDTYVSADTWREEAGLAELTSAERSAALVSAANLGYLWAVKVTLDDGRIVHVDVPTTHAAGKSRRVLLWQRTALRVGVAA